MSFLDADYSAIEARIVCWLAGQEDALQRFRNYDAAETEEEKYAIEPYRIMASDIFQVPVAEVNKHPQRFVGKTAILLLGFQGGAPKFRDTCFKIAKYVLPEGLEDIAVGSFRKKHQALVKLWDASEEAAKKAIIHPGTVVVAVPKYRKGENLNTPLPKFQRLEFECRDINGMQFLLVRLPSGRKLAYPQPKVVPSKRFENRTEVTFFGHIIGAQWGRVSTYGGKIIQNITEGVQSDIMAHGAHNCEKAGYEIATLIHDQALAYHKPGQTAEEFVSLLTHLPDWAKNLPIEAEGGLVPFYKKD